jgi:hypothetical protein
LECYPRQHRKSGCRFGWDRCSPISNIEQGLMPDFDAPAAIDKAATAVELSEWKIEMDMHFA